MGTGTSGADGKCNVSDGRGGGDINSRMAVMVAAVVTMLLVMIYDDAENDGANSGSDGESNVDDGDGGSGPGSGAVAVLVMAARGSVRGRRGGGGEGPLGVWQKLAVLGAVETVQVTKYPYGIK